MEKVTTVGIDLAKSVFSLHGVDGAGRTVLRRTVRRDQLERAVAGLSPCLIGMEACSGAHEWARRCERHGHTVHLMAPKFVIPYRKSGKNDGNDAEAICEAVSRPSMRFVPVKSVEQQARLSEPAQRLMKIRGIGPTTALAIVATVGNAREFDNGRQFAAWLGLVPGQYSTGGRTRLGRIAKRGDAYLRNLLVYGARSVLHTASAHRDRLSRWALELQGRCGYHRTLVAIANKNARIAWALLAWGEALRPE
jgi:transposase